MEDTYTEIIDFIRTNPGICFFFLLIIFGMFAMLYLAVANTPYYSLGV